VQPGHPGQKYYVSWKIGNTGWIGLKKCHGNPTFLVQESPVNEELEVVGNQMATDHPRLVNLIETFQAQSIYLVYRFHGFTVDLGRVCARSQAQLNDVEIATICKHILQGLQYIHSVLSIAHGDLCARNILMYADGQIRIGKDNPLGQIEFSRVSSQYRSELPEK
jgi:serine/threonine protein kinase